MKYGFVKVAAAIPGVQVANPEYNARQIEKQIEEAAANNASVVVFPELCISGYTCGDLLLQDHLIYSSERQLGEILENTKDVDIISIVGMPVTHSGSLYNAAVILHKGRILGVVPKQFLPNYSEFYEQRWFRSGNDITDMKVSLCGQSVDFGKDMVFNAGEFTFAIEICEDLWAPVPISSKLTQAGAEIIFNLSADNDTVSKYNYLTKLGKYSFSAMYMWLCTYIMRLWRVNYRYCVWWKEYHL